MLVVRYVALLALVLWIGGMAAAVLGDVVRYNTRLAYTCGAVIIVTLFIMKFVGPPPHAFIPRVAITAVMLALVALTTFERALAPTILPISMTLGLVLLSWYGRE
jgi:hypothetical protein